MDSPPAHPRVSPAGGWTGRSLFPCFLLLASAAALPATDAPAAFEWRGVERIVAIGDVHGSYDKMLSLLQGTGVVSDALTWAGGQTHLVFIGDLIDRGPRELEVLDLVRRLETEAPAAGGQVHVLLGNHEVMNLVRDLRYVPEEGFKAFEADDKKKDRTAAWQRFRSKMASPTVPLGEIKAAFDKRYPPGFFGRIEAFAPDGEYGSWLINKPAVIKINETVFLHGGLTDEVASVGLEEINRRVRDGILELVASMEALASAAAGAADYETLYRAALALSQTSERGRRAEAVKSFLQHPESLAFSPTGPLWYRGNSVENERLERASLGRAMTALDARSIVVAHTPTGSGRITSRFNGQVFRADIGMAYGREPLGLVIEADEFAVFDPKVAASSPPTPEPPLGEGSSRFQEQLPKALLEEFLRSAEVTSRTLIHRDDRSVEVCELEGEGPELRGAFLSVDEKPDPAQPAEAAHRTFRHEIGAYRLDKLLELDLVPVTVERKLDGVPGSMQIFPEGAVDLSLLRTYGQMHLLDGLEEERAEARIFSALVGVEERHDAGQMFLPQDRRIALADNTKAFPISGVPGPDLPDPCGPLDPELELNLRRLNRQQLDEALRPLISAEQIEALLLRRDRILENCDQPAPSAGG